MWSGIFLYICLPTNCNMHTILNIQIDDEGVLHVQVSSDKIGHYALVGILEEVKQGMLETASLEMPKKPVTKSKKYDA